MTVTADLLLVPAIEVVLMGALAGGVGALAIIHRRIFFAESIMHSTFPGAVLGTVVAAGGALLISGQKASFGVLTASMLIGSIVISIPMMALMRWLTGLRGLSSQASAAVVLTMGFSLGYLMRTWWAPLPLKVDTFLTGSVLNVGTTDVIVSASVAIALVATIMLRGRLLVFYSFDPIGYRAAGGRAGSAEAIILAMICAVIAALVPVVGTILPIAVMAGPAGAVIPWVASPGRALTLSAMVGALTCLCGGAIGVLADLSVGGCIALSCAVLYGVSKLAATARTRVRKPAS